MKYFQGTGSSLVMRFLYPAYFQIMKQVRGNKMLIRRLFEVRLPGDARVFWDFTTLALRKALSARCASGKSVLEIGVGPGALLCLYLAKKFGVKPDGVDVAPEHVESAKRIAEYNSVPLDIRRSDLFENVRRRYDLVFFNSVYIPTRFGETHELERRRGYDDTRGWDGGADGLTTITEFLRQAPDFLSPGGDILLGVNNFYVADARMSDLIRNSGLRIADRVRAPLNPSAVYVLRHKEGENGK